MKPIILLTILASLAPGQTKETFGPAPADQPARDLCARVAGTRSSGGPDAAIRLLDTEGRAFLKKSGAVARFDFFSALKDEALHKSGRDDLAWGTALAEWIYRYGRHDGENYWYRDMVPAIYNLYVAGGRHAAAREVLTYEANLLAEGRDTEFDVSRFVAKEFINPQFPEFRRRVLPQALVQIRHANLLASMGIQDLAEGQWRRALEEAAICKNFATIKLKWWAERMELIDAQMVTSTLTDIWRKGSDVTAESYRFLGMKELELSEYQAISSFRTEQGWALQYVDLAKCRAAHLRYVLGRADKSVIGEMITLRDKIAGNPLAALDDQHRISLLIADIHFRADEPAKGWLLIDQLRADTTLSANIKSRILKEWCRHRVRENLLDDVEPTLIRLLTEAREGGVKREEIDIYQTYAGFLVESSRLNDALQIQTELLRLLRSFDLFPRLPEALHGLARIQALIGQTDAAQASLSDARAALDGKTVPPGFKSRIDGLLAAELPAAATPAKVAEVAGVDLQPRRSMMVPLSDLPARGLFSLTNTGARQQSGNLVLRGPQLSVRPETPDDQFIVDIADDAGEPIITRPLTLQPGEALVVDLSLAASKTAEGAKVDLLWEPNQGEAQSAEWQSDSAEEGVTMAITDASEYLENPFYLMPVYHLLQYLDDFEQAVDVRVVASQPTRIELYDQEDRLVMVDAAGDGDLVSRGDLISQDLNRNSLPDLRLAPSTTEQRFRLFVQPLQAISADGLLLELQMRQQGQWITCSTDRILPGEK